MSWFTAKETIVAQTLSEILEGVRFVRPNLYVQFDASSPFALGKNLTTKLNNEVVELQRRVQNLTIQLKAAEQRAADQKKTAVLPVRDKNYAKVIQLETELNNLHIEMEQVCSSKVELEIRIADLEIEQFESRQTIDELNRLTAQQHQQLIELLGTDFERPQIK